MGTTIAPRSTWRVRMASKGFLSKVTAKGRILGLGFMIAGLLSLLFAVSAHMGVDDLMPTTDPADMQRISDLEDQRAVLLNLAFGAFFLGVFALVVMTERTLPADIAQRQMMSQARFMNELVTGMELKGSAVYLPAKAALTHEKILIPAAEGDVALPTVTDELVISLGPDKATLGVLLTPPGLDLLDGFEKDMAVSNKDAGLEAFEGNMQIAKLGIGLVKDFKLKERGGETILRIEHSAFADGCRTIRELMPDVCRQAACPICSAFLTGIARSTGKIVKVKKVENDTDRIQFHLELAPWE